MTTHVVVLVTTSSTEEAERIGHTLVNRKLAACVNIVNPIRSIYRWQGQVEDGQEVLLIIKTTATHLDAVAAKVTELHSYQVPEIIAVPVVAGSQAYLKWIDEETQYPSGSVKISVTPKED